MSKYANQMDNNGFDLESLINKLLESEGRNVDFS